MAEGVTVGDRDLTPPTPLPKRRSNTRAPPSGSRLRRDGCPPRASKAVRRRGCGASMRCSAPRAAPTRAWTGRSRPSLRPRGWRAVCRDVRRFPARRDRVRPQHPGPRERRPRRVRSRRPATLCFRPELLPFGQTMRARIEPGSKVHGFYGGPEADEEYRCSYGLAPGSRRLLEDGGLRVPGTDVGNEARIIELPEHTFYVATLLVPQMRSAPERPHPLISAFVRTAAASSRWPRDPEGGPPARPTAVRGGGATLAGTPRETLGNASRSRPMGSRPRVLRNRA